MSDVVLHNIKPENIIFCYRQDDADSFEVAQYYQAKRELLDDQLVALPCSVNNIISEAEFVSTIETPLLNAIADLEDPYIDPYLSGNTNRNIWVIILGHHIPHIYTVNHGPYDEYNEYGGSIEYIAIASRLHRLGRPVDYKRPNFTYDRKAFKYFDATDATQLYITSVIDGPTKEVAKKIIDRSIIVDNQQFVTGKILVNPYNRNTSNLGNIHRDDILEFVEKEATYLGLEIETTEQDRLNLTYPTIKSLSNESFYWGRGEPNFSPNLAINQSEKRVFLYNADQNSAHDIAASVDDNGSLPWTNLAITIEPGYAATAGSVEDPGEDAYLRPTPFFETLHRGGSLGECFLFASQYLDWKTFLIGDPLMTVFFPFEVPKNQRSTYTQISDNNEVIRRVKTNIENGLAYSYRQARLIREITEQAILSIDINEIINVFLTTSNWLATKDEDAQRNLFSHAVQALADYTINTTGTGLEQWLSDYAERTTEGFGLILNSSMDPDLVYPTGLWRYDITYLHPRLTLEDVHFQLQIASNSDFVSPNVSVSSSTSNWLYERDLYNFVALPIQGMRSNYSGRRVRYVASENNYLESTETYYVRWRAVDVNNHPITDWTVDPELLIIST